MLSVVDLPASRRAEVRRVLLHAGFVAAMMAAGIVSVTLIKHYSWTPAAVESGPMAAGIIIVVLVRLRKIRRRALSESSRNVEEPESEREEREEAL